MATSVTKSKVNQVISNASVLVIDDCGSIRELVSGILRELGFTKIHVAIDGAKAWTTLQSKTVDFVICDWDMPNLNGMELLNKMKAYDEFKDIPFLMVTASNEPQRVQEAIQNGVSDYIVKPFQVKDLSYRIVKLLRKIKAASS